jgi:hypothetical protein
LSIRLAGGSEQRVGTSEIGDAPVMLTEDRQRHPQSAQHLRFEHRVAQGARQRFDRLDLLDHAGVVLGDIERGRGRQHRLHLQPGVALRPRQVAGRRGGPQGLSQPGLAGVGQGQCHQHRTPLRRLEVAQPVHPELDRGLDLATVHGPAHGQHGVFRRRRGIGVTHGVDSRPTAGTPPGIMAPASGSPL